jgi:hypothetical protein
VSTADAPQHWQLSFSAPPVERLTALFMRRDVRMAGMAQSDEKAFWQRRFSVRALVILVTLVCVYFGLWDATKKFGVPELHPVTDPIRLDPGSKPRPEPRIVAANSPLPLIVRCDERRVGVAWTPVTKKPIAIVTRYRCYYVWLCGPMIKLPFESRLF